jgi:hypothetical protein
MKIWKIHEVEQFHHLLSVITLKACHGWGVGSGWIKEDMAGSLIGVKGVTIIHIKLHTSCIIIKQQNYP